MTESVTLNINGMTCGHCVSHVQRALTELPAIHEVMITLNAGGTSRVVATLNAEVSDEQLAEIVAEEGYTLVSVER